MNQEEKIARTLGEIKDRHDWDKFCEVMGINPWCLNEGLARREDVIWFTIDEAKQCGIVPSDYEGS